MGVSTKRAKAMIAMERSIRRCRSAIGDDDDAFLAAGTLLLLRIPMGILLSAEIVVIANQKREH